MEIEKIPGHVGWSHFLTQRRRMLDQYDEATALTRGKSLQVYKGIVAEQVFRDWLQRFLPYRFGVTSGYIVPPVEEDGFKITNFDVMIFDRLNAPLLWSESGGALAIPVEFVFCVIEVKARLTTPSFKDAMKKLGELTPFLDKVESDRERYKKYLPGHFTTFCVFFETVAKPKVLAQWMALASTSPRACPAIFIMRSQSRENNASAIVRLGVSDSEFKQARQGHDGKFYGVFGTWSDWHFQQFAFTVLRAIEGRLDGLYPSFHALPPSEGIKTR